MSEAPANPAMPAGECWAAPMAITRQQPAPGLVHHRIEGCSSGPTRRRNAPYGRSSPLVDPVRKDEVVECASSTFQPTEDAATGGLKKLGRFAWRDDLLLFARPALAYALVRDYHGVVCLVEQASMPADMVMQQPGRSVV